MGGGGGRARSLTSEETKRLTQIVRETIKESASSEKRNVFISFAHEDVDEVNLLRGQAKNANVPIEFNDWSVKEPFDSENAEYIRRGIRERLRQCSVTIVYLSSNATNSKWVDWEIRESITMGKGVIALHKGETPPLVLPSAVTEHSIPVTPWKHEQLATAIEAEAKKKDKE